MDQADMQKDEVFINFTLFRTLLCKHHRNIKSQEGEILMPCSSVFFFSKKNKQCNAVCPQPAQAEKCKLGKGYKRNLLSRINILLVVKDQQDF